MPRRPRSTPSRTDISLIGLGGCFRMLSVCLFDNSNKLSYLCNFLYS